MYKLFSVKGVNMNIDEIIQLFRFNNKHVTDLTSTKLIEISDLLEQLKEYQQLDEQGRLVKLPIEDKKGDCRECVHTKAQCHHMEYKCSECPLTELFCDEFYKAIDRCYEEAYASGCLAGIELGKTEAEAELSEAE